MGIEWLKVMRISLGLSMNDVAKLMFVTKGTISRIEAGKANNSKSTMLLYELVLKDLMSKK
jgi:transcriptional regulator with XRE-family HTH domain